MTDRQWKYYNMGRKAHAEGLPVNAQSCVFLATDRCWWVAGHIDADLEAGGKTVQALIKELLQCTQ
jgi:hypothetical protein